MNLGIEIWKSSEAPQRHLYIQQPGEPPKGEFCFDISTTGLDYALGDNRSLTALEENYGVQTYRYEDWGLGFRVFGSSVALNALLFAIAKVAEARAEAETRRKVRAPRRPEGL